MSTLEAAREFCEWHSHFQIGNGINQVAAFADQISEQRVKAERQRLFKEQTATDIKDDNEMKQARNEALAKYFGELTPSSPEKIRASAHWMKGFESGYKSAHATLLTENAELEGKLAAAEAVGMFALLQELSTRHPKIVQTRDCMGNQPRLTGHRMRVIDFLANIAGQGYSPKELAENWDTGFTEDDVKAAVDYTLDMVDTVFCKASNIPYCKRHFDCDSSECDDLKNGSENGQQILKEATDGD